MRKVVQLARAEREHFQFGHVLDELLEVRRAQIESIEFETAQFLQRITREKFQRTDVIVARKCQLFQVVAEQAE